MSRILVVGGEKLGETVSVLKGQGHDVFVTSTRSRTVGAVRDLVPDLVLLEASKTLADDAPVFTALATDAMTRLVPVIHVISDERDVEPDSWVLSLDDVAARVTPDVKAIIAVNLFGMPAPVAALRGLGPAVVENCAHGIGGYHSDGTPFGGAGDVSISSFYATKMICGGEGGIVAAGDCAVIERVCKARDYGDQAPDGRHLNDKMTDVEAAIVYEQLCSLENICSRRRERAGRYAALLQPLAEAGHLVVPPTCDGRIWYRYPVCLTNQSAAVFCERMSTAGVSALQPVWDLRGTEAWVETLPGTTRAFDHVLSLPLYPDLTELEQETVVAALAYCLNST